MKLIKVVNLEDGRPSTTQARARLASELQRARESGVAILKVIHGYGSSGSGGVLCAGIRKSLRLRIKEGKAVALIPGEHFSSDANETRHLLLRHPVLRQDRDLNRGNPGITIVELS